MKIEIRVGNTESNRRVKYSFEKYDDVDKEKGRMYHFLLNCKDCIIEDVDNFLLYTINNGIMAFVVKDNIVLQTEYKEHEYHNIPKFDPEIYKVFEIMNDGTDLSIQDEKGHISKNYFNELMNNIMNDYYDSLTFYEI